MGSLEQNFDQPGFDHEWFLLNKFYLGQILLITRCYQLALASQFFGDSSSMFERANYCGSCQGDVRDRSFSYSRRYSGGMFHKLWFIVCNIIIILCIKTCFRFAPMLIFYVIGTPMLVESFLYLCMKGILMRMGIYCLSVNVLCSTLDWIAGYHHSFTMNVWSVHILDCRHH